MLVGMPDNVSPDPGPGPGSGAQAEASFGDQPARRFGWWDMFVSPDDDPPADLSPATAELVTA